jgi:hypothetical protein
VTEEMGLGNLIENAIKQIAEDAKKDDLNDDEDIDEEASFEDSLFDYETPMLTDEDIMDFKKAQEELELEDEDFFNSLQEGEINGIK